MTENRKAQASGLNLSLGHDPMTYSRTYVVGDKGQDKVPDELRATQTGTDG